MLIRLAIDNDEDAVIELMRADVEETKFPHTGYVEPRARETFQGYLARADPVIFVAEEGRKIVGMLAASLVGYRLAYGHKAICEVIYVDPAYRGSRAATRLLRHAEAWARRVGAKELVGGVENNYQPDRTARFFELHGFKRMGYAMTRVLL